MQHLWDQHVNMTFPPDTPKSLRLVCELSFMKGGLALAALMEKAGGKLPDTSKDSATALMEYHDKLIFQMCARMEEICPGFNAEEFNRGCEKN